MTDNSKKSPWTDRFKKMGVAAFLFFLYIFWFGEVVEVVFLNNLKHVYYYKKYYNIKTI